MFQKEKPLVIIDDSSYGNVMTGIVNNSSYGNVMTGMLGHTHHVPADKNCNPGIDLMSAKSVGLDAAPLNQF
jgi:hypothetical protein